MRFVGLEESGVLQSQGLLVLALLAYLLLGLFHLIMLPLPRLEAKGWKPMAKVGTVAHKG
jgi:hypothetical protein